MFDNRSFSGRAAFIGPWFLAAVFLVGCNDGGTGGNAGASAKSPLVTGACDLLTLQEAGDILSGTVQEPQGGAPISSDTVRLTDCTWMESASGKTLTVLLRRSETADNSAQAIAGIRASLATAGPVEDVDGLAEVAFWGTNQLHAFHGNRDYLTVSVSGFDDDEAAPAARRAAEMAIGRL